MQNPEEEQKLFCKWKGGRGRPLKIHLAIKLCPLSSFNKILLPPVQWETLRAIKFSKQQQNKSHSTTTIFLIHHRHKISSTSLLCIFRNKLHFCVATIIYKGRPRWFSFQNKLQLAFLQLMPFLLSFSVFCNFPFSFVFRSNCKQQLDNVRHLSDRDTRQQNHTSWLRRDGQFLLPWMEQQDLHNSQ